MFKSLYWNIRSITSSGAFERQKQFIRLENPPFIVISEPFHNSEHMDNFRKKLGFTKAYSNCNSQIWIFWQDLIDCSVVYESDQHITCTIDWMGTNILVTSVYAKCDEGMREELWDNLKDVSHNYKLP